MCCGLHVHPHSPTHRITSDPCCQKMSLPGSKVHYEISALSLFTTLGAALFRIHDFYDVVRAKCSLLILQQMTLVVYHILGICHPSYMSYSYAQNDVNLRKLLTSQNQDDDKIEILTQCGTFMSFLPTKQRKFKQDGHFTLFWVLFVKHVVPKMFKKFEFLSKSCSRRLCTVA